MNMTAKTVLIAALSVALSTPAMAYVGPGAGVSVLGSIAGLVLALGTALAVVVMLPFRALFKRKKKTTEPPDQMPAGEVSND